MPQKKGAPPGKGGSAGKGYCKKGAGTLPAQGAGGNGAAAKQDSGLDLPLRLLANGYSPLPIPAGTKGCLLEGWSAYCERQPTEADLAAWAKRWSDCGWGIACGQVVGIDLDEDDPDRAAAMAAHAYEVLGPTLAVRIGRAPRRMLVYRAAGPVISEKAHPVEILSAGNQFVAFAIHPDTGKPYRWPQQSLLDIPLADLPGITQDQVNEFLAGYHSDEYRGGGTYTRRQWQRDDNGLVTDGREDFLRHCVWRAYWECADEGEPTVEAVADAGWELFKDGTDLRRPMGAGRGHYGERDAYVKARGIIRKAKAGRLQRGRLIPGIEPEPWPEEHDAVEAKRVLRSTVSGFLVRLGRLLIRAAAGLGKTTEVLDQIKQRNRAIREWQRNEGFDDGDLPVTWFCVPRIELATELADHYGEGAAVIRGRTHGYDPQRRETREQALCKRPDTVLEAMRAGITNISGALCWRVDDTGGVQECPHYGNCPYWQQFDNKGDTEVWFLAHEYLFVALPEKTVPRPDLLVIDEDLLPSLVGGGRGFDPDRLEGHPVGDILLAELRAGRDPRPAVIAAGWDKKALKAEAKTIEDATAVTVSPEMDDAVMLARLRRYTPPVIAGVLRKLADELDLNRPGLRSLIYEAKVPVEFEDGGAGTAERLWLRYRRKPVRIRKGLSVLLLDATADAGLLELALPGLSCVDIGVRRNAEVWQTYGFTASMAKLAGDKQHHRAEVSSLAARLGNNGLLVTYKDAEERIQVPPGWNTEHFGNLRGLDKHKNKDVVVIAGRPQVPPLELEAMARGLFYDSELPLELTGEYEKRPVGFRLYNGERWGVETWVHADPMVDRLRWQLTEAEVFQTADRLRLIHCPKNKRVFLINEVPTLPVGRLVGYRALVRRKGARGAGGGTGARLGEAFERLGGYLPLSAPWLAARFPDLWATPKAAKRELEKCKSKAPNLYINTITDWGPLISCRYKWVKQPGGAMSRCLTAHGADETRAWLEENVESLVAFEVEDMGR